MLVLCLEKKNIELFQKIIEIKKNEINFENESQTKLLYFLISLEQEPPKYFFSCQYILKFLEIFENNLSEKEKRKKYLNKELEFGIKTTTVLLHEAVKRGEIEIVQWLIKNEINVNAIDDTQTSALGFANVFRNYNIVQLLLNNVKYMKI